MGSAESSIGRRTLIGAAIAGPAAAIVPSTLASQALAETNYLPDTRSPRFTLAVLPDTQYLYDEDRTNPAPLAETFQYLLEHRANDNIVFMTHLGDITEHGTASEMAAVSTTFKAIDQRLPYSVLAGNHDVKGSTNDQRGDTPYLQTFGPQRFQGNPTFGGSSPDGYNSYHLIQAGSRRWLVLALDWRLSPQGFAWAQGVIDTHPKLPVIVTTHDFVTGDDSLSDYGKLLWDGLVRRNDQIFLVLNGHWWPPGRAVLTNDAGNEVHAHLTNYQDRYYGGAAMIRLYHFDLARNTIDVETFSPWFLQHNPANLLESETLELTGPEDRFNVAIDFEKRFTGFAARPEPPERPARDLVIRGTVGYWRFKGGADQVVDAGTVVKDQSGKGNHLTVALIPQSPPTVLRWSDDHRTGQPAHGSLRFDGSRDPARGAYLRTAGNAPLNAMEFRDGFTIEAYFKLPGSFDPSKNNWMGILSWLGRSSDAGKTNGDPDEPVASLNVAPEQFLQWIQYPVNRDASPTNWSHAIPLDRWTHVAVVNDGTHTVVYVDGSAITRNPSTPTVGIAASGKPWAIGATQYAEKFDLSFAGWIGDVRIVNHALRPANFMTPFA